MCAENQQRIMYVKHVIGGLISVHFFLVLCIMMGKISTQIILLEWAILKHAKLWLFVLVCTIAMTYFVRDISFYLPLLGR